MNAQSTVNIKVGGANSRQGPRPGDDAGSPLHDLVVRGAGLGTLRRTNPGDARPTPVLVMSGQSFRSSFAC
jgi:hypothetical protein